MISEISPASISILIPVKDGGDDLSRCLAAIARQETGGQPVEVIVVDSGSTDGSVERARSAGALVIEIPQHEFDHGATRNLLAGAAAGETLVFISQDAEPIARDWLSRLTASLHADETIAGAYGRQIARGDAAPPERYFLDFLYGPESRLQQAASAAELSMETTLFSNANSAIRRSWWERFPFADDLIMSEDQDWARRALLAGGRLAYEADATVRHSHPYTISGAFKRFFDSGVSAERAYLSEEGSGRALRANAVDYAKGELRWLVRSGNAGWIPYTCVYELAKFTGLALGKRHRSLPAGLSRRLSAHPYYWDRADHESSGETR